MIILKTNCVSNATQHFDYCFCTIAMRNAQVEQSRVTPF